MSLLGITLESSSCRRKRSVAPEKEVPSSVIAPELKANGLKNLPGAVYQCQANSPIHWQPWTKTTLDRAKNANELVLCVIVMPQQPGFLDVLAKITEDPAMVEAINQNYVPVLVDGDASREMGILTADLCSEIKRPLQLPLFVWMTGDGNPIAWIPLTPNNLHGVPELFNQSHLMVSQMWKDVPEYVLKNSSQDNASRRNRFLQRKVTKVMSEQPAMDVVRSLRQLASLYDPYSRVFDESGGLFPAGAIELLSTAAVRPGLPPDVRARCLRTTRELMVDLLPSAMIDPLDGGVFTSRSGPSWALPTFVRDCPGQARAAVALISAFRATGDPLALEKALGAISFAEKSYGTSEGLFSLGFSPPNNPESWMWKVEDLEQVLPAEDASWWIKATAMKGLGNLPSEADTRREYFRCNTLGLGKSAASIAAEVSQSEESFKPRFEKVRASLLAVRNARISHVTRDECSHAGATFRMVSAYAAAYGATGDEAYRVKASALLKRAREAFMVGPKLRMFSSDVPDSVGAGRAFLYALALQAVLDMADITSDEQWLVWSEDLATTSAEKFTNDEFLLECPDEAKLVDLPITDLVMLFDDSTGGLISSTESRLAELGRPLVASFSELATPMPTYVVDRPLLHTDLLLATLTRHFNITVAMGADLSPSLKTAVERLPVQVIQRRPARSDEQVQAGSVKVILSSGETRLVSTPEALQDAVLPSQAK